MLTPAQTLARIRRICLALPEATEKVAWGSPTFRVRDRIFVMFLNDHHGDGRLAIWCHADKDAQVAMVDAETGLSREARLRHSPFGLLGLYRKKA